MQQKKQQKNKSNTMPRDLDYDKIAYNKLYKLGHRNIISQPASEKYRERYDLINWNDSNDNNGYKLFLDDERLPPDDSWIVATSFDHAVRTVEAFGCPQVISFDHDLGTGKTGMDFAKWLINQALDNPDFIPDGFSYSIHSANPVGAENIRGLLENFFFSRAANG